jgi:dTDP-4-dehydrorhamnose 3,5-epimerase
MTVETKISGVRIFPIEIRQSRMILVKDEDHLLRRFGQVEVRQVSQSDSADFTLRAVADEIWVLVEGSAEIALVDRRAKSPTEDQALKLRLGGEESQGVLIPSGVAYAVYANDAAQFVRLCTHADGSHDGDQALLAEKFTALLSEA